MKLWAGRFSKEANSLVDEFNASIEFDHKLYKQDIQGSIAHARMLSKQGIISEEDCKQIVDGLNEIKNDIEEGKIEFTVSREDIHMNIESILTERIGDAGKRLHTARSRNDQVATDFRLYLKEEIHFILNLLKELKLVLIKIAKQNQDVLMPGYTHLQRAQPITLAFHLMAYFQMFDRDTGRLEDCFDRMDVLPLGSGAMSGTSYETDRQFLAQTLGFSRVSENAMDAVSDRDFAIEFSSACSIMMMHLSRFCEELIIWSSSEYEFIEFDDEFSTGSSIMPQKKNPDVAELIRGKTGSVYGALVALLTIMKALPLAYNKDMQEDKQPVFTVVETAKDSLQIFAKMLETMKIKKQNMANSAKKGFMNATDVADYLAKKGLPFRECHEAVGKMVLACIKKGISIEELSLDELKEYSGLFEEDIYERIDLKSCIQTKKSYGSTSSESVAIMIANAEKRV